MFASRKWLTVKQYEKYCSENGYCAVISFDAVVIWLNY